MRKIIITEDEKKSILGLHGIVEQNTPPVSPTTTPPPATGPKPMFGTPEQRAAAKAKREGQRKINFDRFVKGAFYKNFYEEISDEEYNSGCQVTPNPELTYLDGTSMDLPEYVYREQQDGSKIKINLRKYSKYIKNQSKQEDVALDGLQDPNFKATSCGISKAAAKQDKKDWSKK
ncbi:hypothetical protein EBX93_18450 [bacterium]|nr:hypothetical protein [bacterium]